jgi:hypothetical protein
MLEESAATKVDNSTLLRTHYAFQARCFLSASTGRDGGILAFSETSVSPIGITLRGLAELIVNSPISSMRRFPGITKSAAL